MPEAPRSSPGSPSMPEFAVRVLLVGGLIAAAVAVGMMATRSRRSAQPPVRVGRLGSDAAIIAFTSTDCSRCRSVMRLLSDFDVSVREITYELEPGLFDEAGVEGVPLVVVRRPDGSHSAQFGGVVGRWRLRRALVRAGW